MRSLIVLCLLLTSCATPKPSDSTGPAPTGHWTGDYEAAPGRRDSVAVDLQWENTNLRGTVHAGTRALPIAKASFNKDTSAITLEFDAEGPGGRTVHYVIDGKVNGKDMSGTWSHDDQRGDFHVTKQ